MVKPEVFMMISQLLALQAFEKQLPWREEFDTARERIEKEVDHLTRMIAGLI